MNEIISEWNGFNALCHIGPFLWVNIRREEKMKLGIVA